MFSEARTPSCKPGAVTGHIVHERTSGETIRDTYGDYLVEDGRVVYFEPAVLAAQDDETARKHLAIWAKYSDTDGGMLDDCIPYPAGENVEKTLVLIKPDNFRFPNARLGGVIDLFSRAGLSIIGFKVHYMSVAEAEEFYRPVLNVIMDKLKEPSGKRARLAVEEEFGVPMDAAAERQLGELIGPIAGRSHWESIVQFMAGTRPSRVPSGDSVRCPAPRSASRLCTRGSMRCARSARFSARPIPRRRPSGRSGASSARRSWSTPRMPRIPLKMPSARWTLSVSQKTILVPSSKLTSPKHIMQLATRVQELTPSLTLAIDSKAKALKAEGIDVCGFGAGEPDMDTPEHIKAACIEAIQAGFTKYTPSSGIPELRQAISEKFKNDNNLEYKPSQIIVSNGAKQSCYNAVAAVCDPGDEVIIPAPYWLSYPEMVRLAGAEPVIVQTTEENAWKMTAEQFENAMTPKTKMIIINSPGNPTGSVYTKEELRAISEVAAEEEIFILSDEIYERLTYEGAEHVSIASLTPEAHDLTITVNGFSKAYAMTGWRLGYLGAPEAIAKAIDSMQSHSTSNPCSFAQKGGLAALKGDQQCVTDMRDEFDIRREYMFDRLSNISGLSAVRPLGAFYVLVNIGTSASSRKISPTGFSARPTLRSSPASPLATIAPSGSATRQASTSSRRASIDSKSSAKRCKQPAGFGMKAASCHDIARGKEPSPPDSLLDLRFAEKGTGAFGCTYLSRTTNA